MAKGAATKDVLKSAGMGAVEKALQTFLPEIMTRLDALQQQIGEVRKEVGDVRKEVGDVRKDMAELRRETSAEIAEFRAAVDAKFEKNQELINELGLRINTVGTRLDTYFEFARRDSAKMDSWLERLVRVEEAQKPRSRRAS
jgi:hypothetical protein